MCCSFLTTVHQLAVHHKLIFFFLFKILEHSEAAISEPDFQTLHKPNLFVVDKWTRSNWTASNFTATTSNFSSHWMSHNLNQNQKDQRASQAAAEQVRFEALHRKNLSCKPIRLPSHDLSLQVWIVRMICGFESLASVDNRLISMGLCSKQKAAPRWVKWDGLLRCQCIMSALWWTIWNYVRNAITPWIT